VKVQELGALVVKKELNHEDTKPGLATCAVDPGALIGNAKTIVE
jgi:hypothetical protein